MDNYLSVFAVSFLYVILLIFNNGIFKKINHIVILIFPFLQFFLLWVVFWRRDNFIEVSAIVLGSLFGICSYLLIRRSLKYIREEILK